MKRTDLLITAGLSLGAFVLYVRTLALSLLPGDSAEFQAIAYTLGLGHPTGYPVYVLLAKIFTLIPVGEIAYRVNLFSAFCAALAVGLIYLILRQLGLMIIPSLCGGLALALTSIFWKYACIAEIYTVSAACLAFVLFAVFYWNRTRNSRWLCLAALTGGLSLGIHTTVALSAIPILLYLILSTRQRMDWLQALFGALLGLVIFLSSFLLLDFLDSPAGYYNAVVRPSLSVWGMTPADFDSPFERLAFLYFPPQFKERFLGVSFDEVLSRSADFAAEMSSSLWLALLGVLWLLFNIPQREASSRWREAVLVIMAFITFLGFTVTYDVSDFQVFYIPAILMLVIFVGTGVHAIMKVITLIPRLPRIIPGLLGFSILIMGLYTSANDISIAWRERMPPRLEDWETNYQSTDEHRLKAEQVLSRIEDNAIVFTSWDKLYGFYYVSHVLQGRTDMDFHEAYPQEGVTKFADSAVQYIQANIEQRPIYFTMRAPQLAKYYKMTRAASGLLQIERR